MQPSLRPGMRCSRPSREVRADQYGIRTLLRTEGIDIKFEIVREGRIELEQRRAPPIACVASPR